jgi:hypothetical protein
MTKHKHTDRPRWQGPATGHVTKDEIEKLLASGVRSDVVSHLGRQQIKVAADGIFQWRDREEDPERKPHHVGVLVHDLRITGEPFDPLVVFPAGGRYFVMEGHHRLAAYEAVNWSDPIPVELFRGTLQDARIAALESNHNDKLPMSRAEKSNAAWRLVVEGQPSGAVSDDWLHSIERTARLGKVSPATVKNCQCTTLPVSKLAPVKKALPPRG